MAGEQTAGAAPTDEDVFDASQSVDGDEAPETEEQEQPQEEEAEQPEEEGEPQEEQPFPKKAANAIRRYKSDNRKLRAQVREYQIQLQQLQTKSPESQQEALKEPTRDDFESYGDYLEARQDYLYQKGRAENQQQTEKDQVQQTQERIVQMQRQVVENAAQEFVTEFPEAQELLAANTEAFAAAPSHIEQLVLELPDPVSAMYAVAKEGRLADLYQMSPQLAAVELSQAQARGRDYLKGGKKPAVSKAPKPMAAAKGNGATSLKSPDQMTDDEFGKWLDS